VLGLKGDVDVLDKNWKWDAYYQLGRTHHDQRQDPMLDLANFYAAVNVVPDANGNPVCGPYATNPNFPSNAPLVIGGAANNVSPGCVPFNVFGQKNSAQAIAFVTGEDRNTNVIHQDFGGITVTGSPYTLPAGDVSLAFGFEARKESVYALGDKRGQIQAWQTLQPSTYTGSQNVKEAFVEVGVPVMKDYKTWKDSMKRLYTNLTLPYMQTEKIQDQIDLYAEYGKTYFQLRASLFLFMKVIR
jgi:hypothetical protein